MQVKETYTAKELMPMLGLTSVSSVLRRAERESWGRIPRAKKLGGDLFKIAEMPQATRAAVNTALVAIAEAPARAEHISDVVIPDWAFEMGKARARLVMEWRSYVAKAEEKDTPKMIATDEFFTLVQSGMVLPAKVLETVGKYSIKSFYRWDKLLRENGDNLEALADKRGKWLQGGAKGLGQLGAEAESLLLGAWLTPNKPSVQLAYNATAAVLKERGLSVPSYTSARRFLQRFDSEHHDLVTLKRQGEKALKDTIGPYIARNDKILAVGGWKPGIAKPTVTGL